MIVSVLDLISSIVIWSGTIALPFLEFQISTFEFLYYIFTFVDVYLDGNLQYRFVVAFLELFVVVWGIFLNVNLPIYFMQFYFFFSFNCLFNPYFSQFLDCSSVSIPTIYLQSFYLFLSSSSSRRVSVDLGKIRFIIVNFDTVTGTKQRDIQKLLYNMHTERERSSMRKKQRLNFSTIVSKIF